MIKNYVRYWVFPVLSVNVLTKKFRYKKDFYVRRATKNVYY